MHFDCGVVSGRFLAPGVVWTKFRFPNPKGVVLKKYGYFDVMRWVFGKILRGRGAI